MSCVRSRPYARRVLDLLDLGLLWRRAATIAVAAFGIAYAIDPEWAGQLFLVFIEANASRLEERLLDVLQPVLDGAAAPT